MTGTNGLDRILRLFLDANCSALQTSAISATRNAMYDHYDVYHCQTFPSYFPHLSSYLQLT